MKYTVEQQGEKWIASNGTDHVEGDSPDDALYTLLSGETDRDCVVGGSVDSGSSQVRLETLRENIGRHVVLLIELIATNAPDPLLTNETKVIDDLVRQWLEERR